MEPVLLQMGSGMDPGSGMGFGWGAGLFGWFTMLLVLVGIIALLVWVFRQFRGRSSGGSDDAMEQLRERYASGEISDEEFDERASQL